jgi:hypothetical protein
LRGAVQRTFAYPRLLGTEGIHGVVVHGISARDEAESSDAEE